MRPQRCKPASARTVPFRVFVGGMPCDITVYSNSEIDSLAVGEYSGTRIEVRGTSPLGAAEAWAKAGELLRQTNQNPDSSNLKH